MHLKQDPMNVVCFIGGMHDGIAFGIVGSDGCQQPGMKKDITCFKCKEKGHVAQNCPNSDEMATQEEANRCIR